MSFFRLAEIEAAEAARHPDLLTRMHAGDLDGVVAKGVYSAQECSDIRESLEAGRHELLRTEFPEKFKSSFYGINLNSAHPDLASYFAETPRFRAAIAKLFPGDLDLERRAAGLMRALDGGRAYEAPPGPAAGQSYMFATLRWHRAGGYIPAHFDDEQAARPSFRHLSTLIARKLTSYVLPFSQAEAGGELEVFDAAPDAEGRPIAHRGRSATQIDVTALPSLRFRLAPGDMIVFRSGRFLHRLTPVEGARDRWNACSFMAESCDRSRVYCWG